MDIKELENLSPEELLKLITTAQLLYSKKRVVNNSVFLYEEIKTEIYKRIKKKYPEISILKKKSPKVYKLLVDVTDFLNKWIKENIKDINKNHLLTLYKLYAIIICDFLEKSDIILSLETVLYNYEKFPELVEFNFPGYIKSGLLIHII